MIRRALLISASLLALAGGALAQSSPQPPGPIGNPWGTKGPHNYSGGSPVPSLGSGCGTGASFVGSDATGQVTMGTSPTSCPMTFGTPYVNPPSCEATSPTASVSYTVTPQAINFTSPLAGEVIHFICTAQAGG